MPEDILLSIRIEDTDLGGPIVLFSIRRLLIFLRGRAVQGLKEDH